MITIHIIIAIVSLASGVAAVLKTSQNLLALQLASLGLTLASGAWLVLANGLSLAHFCVSGLVFSVLSVGLAAIAKSRLAQAA